MPTDCFITRISSPDMLTLLACSVLKLTRFIRLNLKLGIKLGKLAQQETMPPTAPTAQSSLIG